MSNMASINDLGGDIGDIASINDLQGDVTSVKAVGWLDGWLDNRPLRSFTESMKEFLEVSLDKHWLGSQAPNGL